MAAHALILALVGIASPPVRLTPPVSSRPPLVTRGMPVPLPPPQPPSEAAALPAKVPASLSGQDILSIPNVFRGLSSCGEMLQPPMPLGREEEVELVDLAIFSIASNDAQRRLAVRDDIGLDAAAAAFMHTEVLDEMRRAAGEAARAAAAARRSGRPVAAEAPCRIPHALGEMEFRVRQAMGRAAYNKLFLHNQKLIYYEVNKVWPNWSKATVIEKADFLQEGAQGLLRAIRLFDPARGVRFSTYAAWHVRAFVLRALRDKSHVVRLPQNLQLDMGQLKKARYRYSVENQGHAPSSLALAEMLQWPATRVDGAIKGLAGAAAKSLDDVGGGGAGGGGAGGAGARTALLDRVPAAQASCAKAENLVYQAQLQTSLSDAMAERDPKRTQITRLKFGLEDGVEWTYPELAARFGLTANVAKGIVRTEVNFLRRTKRRQLQDFVGHAS